MKYKKPPIIEVFARVAFSPGENARQFTQGSVEEFFEEFDDFTIKDVTFNRTVEFNRNKKIKTTGSLEAARAFASGELEWMQVGRNYFSFHLLKDPNQIHDYPGFECLKENFSKYFEVYVEFFTPGDLSEISLCYRDKIDIEATSIELEQYFNIYPYISMSNYKNIVDFNIEVTSLIQEDDSKDTLQVALRPVHRGINNKSMSFTVDWSASTRSMLDMNGLGSVLTRLHEHTHSSFEQAFTEKCTMLFEPQGEL